MAQDLQDDIRELKIREEKRREVKAIRMARIRKCYKTWPIGHIMDDGKGRSTYTLHGIPCRECVVCGCRQRQISRDDQVGWRYDLTSRDEELLKAKKALASKLENIDYPLGRLPFYLLKLLKYTTFITSAFVFVPMFGVEAPETILHGLAGLVGLFTCFGIVFHSFVCLPVE